MRPELAVLSALLVSACGGEATPRDPIVELIEAIGADDPGPLAGLCVPEVRDGDARRVCLARREDTRVWEQLRAWFRGARVVGVKEIHGDEVVIDVAMGPDQRIIPMTVVQHEGRWLLDRF
jgi:hypothetical protein